MFQVKQNTSFYAPIRLYDTVTNAPTTGVAYTTVTITVEKADGTTAAVTVLNASWSEIVTGAFAGSGNYTYLLPSSVTNVPGRLRYAVYNSAPATTAVYTGVVDIVAALASDLSNLIGTPAGTTVSADVATVRSAVSLIPFRQQTQLAYNFGTAPGAFEIYLVKTDGTPATGVTTANTTLSAVDPSGTVLSRNGTNYTLTEITTSPFTSTGLYRLNIATGFFSGGGWSPGNDSDLACILSVSSPANVQSLRFKYHQTTYSFQGTNTSANSALNNTITLINNIGTSDGMTQPADLFTLLGSPAGGLTGSVSADILQVEGHAASADTQSATAATQATTAATQASATNTKLGTPAGASVSADIAAVKVDTAELVTIGVGKWKIFKTGIDANRLVLYALDGTTVLKKFDLKDDSGNPSTTTVFERDPI